MKYMLLAREEKDEKTYAELKDEYLVKWTAEGAVKWEYQSILRRVGIRQLPGICWYPAKCTGRTVNSRWHRG